jgi:hypothetical protein
MRSCHAAAYCTKRFALLNLLAMSRKVTLLVRLMALMAPVLGMRGRMPFLMAVVPQVPKVLALRMFFDVLETRPLGVVPLFVMRSFVRVIVRRTALELVRMTHTRDIAAGPVPPINNRHRASPLT